MQLPNFPGRAYLSEQSVHSTSKKMEQKACKGMASTH